MTNPVKFALIAAVVVAIVAGGYYMAKKKAKEQGKAPIKSPVDALNTLADALRGKSDDKFARTADGKVDYSRKADGSFIRV